MPVTYWVLISILMMLVLHFIYFRLTCFKKIVQLKDKVVITKGTTQQFVAYDEKGKRYIIDSCLWAGKLNPQDQWTKIEEGSNYVVCGYGLEVPMLDRYPCIYSVDYVKKKI